jgi:hypothetical protein
MKAHQLFKHMPAETAQAILRYFQDQDRPVYRSALDTLGAGRRVRPVFILKKTKPEQAEWCRQALALAAQEEIALQLLQIWLLKARPAMLIAFLDALGIAHDGNGAVDDMPATLDAEKVPAAVEALLSAHAPAEVVIYLHMFQMQRENGWPEIHRLLEEDPRLRFAA